MVETGAEAKPDPIQQFLRAARGNNLTRLEELLDRGVDINASNTNGLTGLHLAAKEGHVDAVKLLLSKNINVDAATKKGNTALHIASLAGQLDVTQLLIEAGANINVQSQNGFTPLYMAAQENHVDLVSFLLVNQAKQTIATQDGFTPLAVALQQGHDKVVAVLLEKDSRTKVRLPALHIAAKKDDVSATMLLLNSETNIDQQSSTGFTPLHIASHYGNVNVAYLLIQNKADVNFQAKNNITPMHVAAKWGHLNMIQLLIEAEAIIDCRTRDGLTPLHCAARAGYTTCVDQLLAAGADVSTRTKNGLSPLHVAVQGNHDEVVSHIIASGADVNETTVDYLTPLHISGHCGNVKVAHTLLDNGCEVNARALNGFTPLHIACKKLKIKIVELLLDFGALIEATTETGLTPLHVASFVGGRDIVLLLIQKGANVNETTMRNETALHLAARNRQTDIVKVLLRNGAHVDAKASENQTALHVATRTGSIEVVTILLDAGADINQMTRDNYTSLHIAAKEGFNEIAQYLIKNRADLEARTKKGFTPLHIAAKYGQAAMTNLLLSHNVDLNCSGRNGLSPLHVATHFNHIRVCDILLQAGADTHLDAKNGYTALHIAAKKNHLDIAVMLLEHEAATEAESRSGFTPLHLAAQEGHLKMVALLLKYRAPVNHKAKNGLTALHLTSQEDHVTVAELLEESGAEISPVSKAGYTPLHTASHFGQVNMMRFLMRHQAPVNDQTHLGFTPLHLAAQQGHLQAVNLLLQNHADPNVKNEQGYTAAHIARRQHYLNIFEVLKRVTTVVESWEEIIEEETITLEKPEHMGEHPMSDSDDEQGSTPSSKQDLRKSSKRKHRSLNRVMGDSSDSMHTSDSTLDKKTKKLKQRVFSNDSFYTSNNDDIWSQMEYTKTNLTKTDTKSADTLKSATTSGSLGEDSLHESTIQEPKDFSMLEKSETFNEINEEFARSHLSNQYASNGGPQPTDDWDFETDNVIVERRPVLSGFLVSFLVDARGGILQAQRQPDFRVLIPPQAASGPTRVTCRLMKPDRLYSPPALNDGDGLAAKILEMGPRDLKFDSPILLEIPHFAALREREREIIILRSDNGESWKEHRMDATDQAVREILGDSFKSLPSNEELQQKRIVRILTSDLPLYFALITRVRHENSMVGADGAVLSSSVVSQVQAVFPREALQKKIKVGLQVLPVPVDLITKLVGNRVAMSPVITIEPRRRKFHKPITITLPIPSTQGKGMQNPGDTSTLRLLCSITGGSNVAVWEDITTNTPLKREKNCISFTTTVSARLWLVDCPMSTNLIELVNHVYRECTLVPYIGRFHVYARRLVSEEAQIRCICTIDDTSDRTLEAQEEFKLIASGPEVEIKNNRVHWLETAGNLIPVTKTGDQLQFGLSIFKENRLPFLMRIKDLTQEAVGKLAFMMDSRTTLAQIASHMGGNAAANKPITLLELVLPYDILELEEIMRAKKKARNVAKSWGAKKADKKIEEEDELNLTDVAHAVSKDWKVLAEELGLDEDTIDRLDEDDHQSMEDKCLNMLKLWQDKQHDDKGTDLALARALNGISRPDVVKLYFDEDKLLLEEEKQKNGESETDDKVKSDQTKEEKPVICPITVNIQPPEIPDEAGTPTKEPTISKSESNESLPKGTFEYIEPEQGDELLEEKSGRSSPDEGGDRNVLHKLSTSREIIAGEPEEITKEEEFEEKLPDGSTLKHKVKETEISQTITSQSIQEICSDEQGNLEVELELRASQGDLTGTDDHQIIREPPQEVVDTKETEEEQPDGTVVKKTVTTKHVTQRTTEKIVERHSTSESEEREDENEPEISDQTDSDDGKEEDDVKISSSSTTSNDSDNDDEQSTKLAPGQIQRTIIIEQEERHEKGEIHKVTSITLNEFDSDNEEKLKHSNSASMEYLTAESGSSTYFSANSSMTLTPFDNRSQSSWASDNETIKEEEDEDMDDASLLAELRSMLANQKKKPTIVRVISEEKEEVDHNPPSPGCQFEKDRKVSAPNVPRCQEDSSNDRTCQEDAVTGNSCDPDQMKSILLNRNKDKPAVSYLIGHKILPRDESSEQILHLNVTRIENPNLTETNQDEEEKELKTENWNEDVWDENVIISADSRQTSQSNVSETIDDSTYESIHEDTHLVDEPNMRNNQSDANQIRQDFECKREVIKEYDPDSGIETTHSKSIYHKEVIVDDFDESNMKGKSHFDNNVTPSIYGGGESMDYETKSLSSTKELSIKSSFGYQPGPVGFVAQPNESRHYRGQRDEYSTK